jgi:hypothetical protein
MKILLIGNFGVAWDGSVTDEKNISGALTNLGHEVTEIQREQVAMLGTLNEPELIIISQWDGYEEHVCQRLKNIYKCPVIYWAFDYNRDDTWHFEMAKEADVFLAADYGRKAMYDELGVNFIWFPQSFAPDFLQPSEVKEEYDVVFTGSLGAEQDGRRSEVLRAVDEKFDLHIFTVTPQMFEGFKNVHPAAVDEALQDVVAKARINLSVDSWHVAGNWSDRNAQIMACGGFCLFKHVPLSCSFFQDGVEYFHTTEECLEKIQHFLDHPMERMVTSLKGMQMAEDFKATNRVKMMLEEVKGAL